MGPARVAKVVERVGRADEEGRRNEDHNPGRWDRRKQAQGSNYAWKNYLRVMLEDRTRVRAIFEAGHIHDGLRKAVFGIATLVRSAALHSTRD
jgi:hypothetical protein